LASAWGSSWGASWGSSWGATGASLPNRGPFQCGLFQPNVFQNDCAAAVQPSGGSAKRKPDRPNRRKHYVEIDGQYFEVRNQRHAEEILAKLREAAKEVAPKVAKAAEPSKPIAAPRVTIREPDYSQEFVQRLQAQVDAANAAIAEIYRQAQAAQFAAAVALMARRAAEDEDDIAMLLTMGIL
jgi:hypothetical protein